MSKIAWIITDNNITVRYDNQTHIVQELMVWQIS